jgi:hypothetical protein
VRCAGSEILADEVSYLWRVVALGVFALLWQAEETSEFHDLSHQVGSAGDSLLDKKAMDRAITKTATITCSKALNLSPKVPLSYSFHHQNPLRGFE